MIGPQVTEEMLTALSTNEATSVGREISEPTAATGAPVVVLIVVG